MTVAIITLLFDEKTLGSKLEWGSFNVSNGGDLRARCFGGDVHYTTMCHNSLWVSLNFE
jgi:hypothetical protein